MPEFNDLIGELELPQCHCLNETKEHTLNDAIKVPARDDPSSYLESDSDEELLMHIKFMQAVRISGIVLQGPGDHAPKSVKLFKNKVGIDFDSAKSDKATEELELSASQATSGDRIELRFVNFQGVQTLDIFVGSNQGDEEQTQISKIAILGEVVTQSGLKRSAEEQASATKADWLGKGIA